MNVTFICPWCEFQSKFLEIRNKHIIEEHKDKITIVGDWACWMPRKPIEPTVKGC